MYPKVFRSSPFPFGNTDRVSGRHTIVVPIGTSQDACVEKQKCASLAQLRIYRSGTPHGMAASSKKPGEVKPTTSRRHPLQRFDSPSKGFSGALHVAGLISFYSSFKFLVDNPNIFNLSFGWHLQFLTIIGLSLSTVTFIFGLIADLTSTALSKSPSLNSDPPAVALSEHLFRFKNYLALVAAPIEVTISVLYWTLKAIDGKLLVPPDLPLPPAIYDLGFHLVPAVVLTLDYVLLSPPWPTTPMNESAPMITLALSTNTQLTISPN
ncbi:far-17a aig1-like protein [Alternaria alternata]|nr:far-17a aig1-like protein [Alternaria alternata]